jgi:hypothetical protein
MCCGEKQGHKSVPMTQGVCQSGAREMCGCGERKFLSKKERIVMLEEYKESLKCELEGVEEELKSLQTE